MDILKLMEERHSVRSYLDKPIDGDVLARLQEEIERVNQESGLSIGYVPAGDAFGGIALKMIGWKNCRGALVLAGQLSDDLPERCGYWGEHLVLFCQSLGLNTCWAGMARQKEFSGHLAAGEGYVMAIGVGYGATPGHKRRSKRPNQVASIGPNCPAWFLKGVEYALLAPTALNRQGFHFELEGERSVVATASGSGAMARVDLGIVCYHFEAASGVKPRLSIPGTRPE